MSHFSSNSSIHWLHKHTKTLSPVTTYWYSDVGKTTWVIQELTSGTFHTNFSCDHIYEVYTNLSSLKLAIISYEGVPSDLWKTLLLQQIRSKSNYIWRSDGSNVSRWSFCVRAMDVEQVDTKHNYIRRQARREGAPQHHPYRAVQLSGPGKTKRKR